MKKDIWSKLDKPIFVLAPMADVTDIAFRQIINKYGKPDIFFTEFVSADGLFLSPVRESLPLGKRSHFEKIAFTNRVRYDHPLLQDLQYDESQRPIIAQFFSNNPDLMKKAAELAREMGFDGIDINMGCPDRSIEKQGAGAAMMKDKDLAVEIIKATKKGAGDLPVSVKTRIGYNENELHEWLPKLLSANPKAVTIHARTRREMSKVPAQWKYIKEAVKIRDGYAKQNECSTLILGNGDLIDLNDAKNKIKETGADGAMFGRAIFGNPWLFNGGVDIKDISTTTKLKVMIEHTLAFEELLPHKNFAIMKKHYKSYVNGFNGAKELRIKLMEAGSAEEVCELTENFITNLKQ